APGPALRRLPLDGRRDRRADALSDGLRMHRCLRAQQLAALVDEAVSDDTAVVGNRDARVPLEIDVAPHLALIRLGEEVGAVEPPLGLAQDLCDCRRVG